MKYTEQDIQDARLATNVAFMASAEGVSVQRVIDELEFDAERIERGHAVLREATLIYGERQMSRAATPEAFPGLASPIKPEEAGQLAGRMSYRQIALVVEAE